MTRVEKENKLTDEEFILLRLGSLRELPFYFKTTYLTVF